MGGHLYKFAGNLQVQTLHLFQVGKILVQDIRNSQVFDFNFIFLQQHQNQAQRALKILHAVFLFYDAFQMKAQILHHVLIIR